MDAQHTYAAIDLGSNSFHLVIMEDRPDGKLVSVNCRRELVQLAAGVDPDTGRLNNNTSHRALRCLSQFHQYLNEIPPAHIKAVGTSAFRRIGDSQSFKLEAEKALGVPIDILSGEDEAQLIYRGVSRLLPNENRFVVDIGGGSTELIVGKGTKAKAFVSLDLGCVTLSKEFFSADHITKEHMDQAEAHVSSQLLPCVPMFKQFDWQHAMATSGTVKSISWALQNLKLSDDGSITLESLQRLRPVFYQTDNLQQLSQLLGLNLRRTQLLAGGYTIMLQTFLAFGLEKVEISHQAIREGMIDSLLEAS